MQVLRRGDNQANKGAISLKMKVHAGYGSIINKFACRWQRNTPKREG